MKVTILFVFVFFFITKTIFAQKNTIEKIQLFNNWDSTYVYPLDWAYSDQNNFPKEVRRISIPRIPPTYQTIPDGYYVILTDEAKYAKKRLEEGKKDRKQKLLGITASFNLWNGLKNGPVIFYQNGKVICTGQYKDDKMTDKWSLYNDFGQPIAIMNYKNGQLDGEFLGFTDYTSYSKPTLLKKPESNYLVVSAFYKEGILNGAYTTYTAYGNTYLSGRYKDGFKTGRWESFFPTGALESICYYNDSLAKKKS